MLAASQRTQTILDPGEGRLYRRQDRGLGAGFSLVLFMVVAC